MTLKLKVGKRYVRRDERITDPLIANPIPDMPSFPFMNPATKATYTASGSCWHNARSHVDLISEYKPAKPEWRVVVTCSSRDNARLVASILKEKNPRAKITVEKS